MPTTPAELSAAQREHTARVTAHIRQAIDAAGGSIDFARYMELALYAPGLGYYSAGTSKLGAAGDFVTAPDVSTLFSRCIARQTASLLDAVGGVVIEVGAGRGTMAGAILPELGRLGHPDAEYWILERSADLRERQRQRLGEFGARVRWLESWPESPVTGVVLANELLDAIPVQRFRVGDQGVECALVVHEEDRFRWHFGAAGAALEAEVEEIERTLGAALPAGYVSEVAPLRRAWLDTVSASLEKGAVLLLDYGYPRREYYHPARSSGTLRCHLRHRAHDDPFLFPGLQDITAHVDFSALASGHGLELQGFTTQADFLLQLGVLDMLSGLAPGTPEFIRLTGQIKRLTLPGEMGESVKAMALGRGLDAHLAGFAGRDHRDRL